MGRDGTDINAGRLLHRRLRQRQLLHGQRQLDLRSERDGAEREPVPELPGAAATGVGTGTSSGDADQFGELVGYVTTTPPENQECSWTKHAHPPFQEFKPLEVTPGPTCP